MTFRAPVEGLAGSLSDSRVGMILGYCYINILIVLIRRTGYLRLGTAFVVLALLKKEDALAFVYPLSNDCATAFSLL